MASQEGSEKKIRMYRQILSGVKKDETELSLNSEESKLWDKIELEVNDEIQKNPGVILEIPWDIEDFEEK
jgi:hypothetical protein